MKLHWQIAIALALAAAAGAGCAPDSALSKAGAFVGTLFLDALKMLVVSLIVSSLMQALVGLSAPSWLSRTRLQAPQGPG